MHLSSKRNINEITGESNAILPVWARIILIIIAYLFVGGFFHIICYEFFEISIEELDMELQFSVNKQLIFRGFDLFSVIIVVFLFRKIIDSKSIISLGFPIRNRFNDLFFGFILAALILGIGSFFLFITNEIEIADVSMEHEGFWKNLIILLFVSLSEEILFRGYILNNLMDSTNKYLALFISSIIFCGLHLLNSHISFLAILNLFLAGVLLGALYIFTRNLWFPISQHLFWNFIQGPVMGFNVSGHETDSILLLKYSEKNIINGGDFGFEGSIICTILSIIFIVLIFHYQNRKKKLYSRHI